MSDSESHLLAGVRSELRTLFDDPMEWIFLVGNRLTLAGGVFGLFVALFYGLWWGGYVPLVDRTAVIYLLSSLIGGNLTLVTLVISISQLVISRQLGSPGELREQITNVTQYRQDVLDPESQDVVPVTPSDFLKAILQNTRQGLEELDDEVSGSVDEEVHEDVHDLVSDLTDHIDRVTELVERTGSGTFDTLSATLTTNYADRIYEVRQLKAEHGDDLSDESNEYLDEVVTRLKEIDVARQYFKTLYTQTELSYISRALLYAGVVAEAVLVSTLLTLTASSGAPIPLTLIPLVAGVGLLPLSVLFPFVLRLAIVTQRTAAITPFTTPEQEEKPL